MATKSILKSIDINDRTLGKNFSEALEKAETAPYKDVKLSRKCTTLKGDAVKDFLKVTKQ